MKKILLAAALLVSATTITGVNYANAAAVVKFFGRHIPASQVPAPVLASFDARYPTATNVKWEKEREDSGLQYKADFMIGNQRYEARFAPDGTFLGQKRK